MSETSPPIDANLFDQSVPASEDFYRHVNGGWLKSNPVPEEFPAWGAFLEVHIRNEEILHELLEEAATTPGAPGSPAQMVGDYFAAGMDEATVSDVGVGPLEPLLAAIESVEGNDELRNVLAEMVVAGVSPLHRVSVSPDFEDPDRYLLYVGQGGLGLPERDYYLRDDEQSTGLRSAYVDHVATQLANLGVDPNPTEAATSILDLETRLATASYPAEKMRDLDLTLNRHEIDRLDDLMPGLGLRSLVRSYDASSPSVNIDNPGYFTDLDRSIDDTPPDVVRSYLRWHLVRNYANSLPPDFERASFEFYGRTLGGQKEMRPRWARVLARATSDIGELVAQLYVERAFSAESKTRCEEMVGRLVESMRRSIDELDWMTDTTKQAALVKLDAFNYKIGYPDRWRDYSALAVDRSSFVGNRLKASRFESNRQLGRLGEPVDRSEWAMAAHEVNAYYHPSLNEIVFPAGILQPPFFYADADDAVNYGAIGAVIGHEITHGFDDMGSKFDEAGRKRNWWQEQDREEFERRAAVLRDQFSGYETTTGATINGQLTLGENIADLGGLSIAYHALPESDGESIDGFSREQRFFIAFATMWRMNYTDEYLDLLVNVDVHSPTMFRVNGPLSNFPPFAEAFEIPGQTPMCRSSDSLARIW
jgi:putative endopeptidase